MMKEKIMLNKNCSTLNPGEEVTPAPQRPNLSLTSQRTRLYNRLAQEEAKAQLMAEDFARVTISFYQYFSIENPVELRDLMFSEFSKLGVFGRVYLAQEGINAQISLPEANVESFRAYLDTIPELRGIRLNKAFEDDGKSFWVLKIKVRDKIVADGISDPSFDMRNKGKYVTAEEFNQMTADPEVVVVDMRNHYEYEVGHFENAKEIPSTTFREQLPMAVAMLDEYKNKPIIMYCTGGIRCEKASAWMLHQGFKQVYHLEGGIINYINQVRQKGLTNKFRGKNFVFDGRLGEKADSEIIAHCHQCGALADTHINCANPGCHLLFIQCPTCSTKFSGCCSTACQEVIQLPEATQRELRKGQVAGAKIFNKARNGLLLQDK